MGTESDIVHDYVWLLTLSFLILMMQGGFALYEAGMVRGKNVYSVFLKNISDGAVGAIFFFLFGYGIAFGPGGNGFVGGSNFAGDGITGENVAFVIFQYSFAATSSTIMSGAVAERINFLAYLALCGIVNSVLYAFVAHWIWSPDGWLNQWGFFDFAGCAVVHMVGGFCGLAGALYMGPRIGRFEVTKDGKKIAHEIPMSNPGLVVLGVFILQWGWNGFNCGSTLRVTDGWYLVAGMVAFNTILAASMGLLGGLVYSMLKHYKEGYWINVMDCVNGLLAGLIGITGAAPVVTFGWAMFIGFMSSILVLVGADLVAMHHLVDDPVGAFPMHGLGGLIGIIWVGLLASPEPSRQKYPVTGAFYGNPEQLGKQLVGALVVAIWSFSLGYLLCFLVDKFVVTLRVDEVTERVGLGR